MSLEGIFRNSRPEQLNKIRAEVEKSLNINHVDWPIIDGLYIDQIICGSLGDIRDCTDRITRWLLDAYSKVQLSEFPASAISAFRKLEKELNIKTLRYYDSFSYNLFNRGALCVENSAILLQFLLFRGIDNAFGALIPGHAFLAYRQGEDLCILDPSVDLSFLAYKNHIDMYREIIDLSELCYSMYYEYYYRFKVKSKILPQFDPKEATASLIYLRRPDEYLRYSVLINGIASNVRDEETKDTLYLAFSLLSIVIDKSNNKVYFSDTPLHYDQSYLERRLFKPTHSIFAFLNRLMDSVKIHYANKQPVIKVDRKLLNSIRKFMIDSKMPISYPVKIKYEGSVVKGDLVSANLEDGRITVLIDKSEKELHFDPILEPINLNYESTYSKRPQWI
ncbi:MAG: hypothetical protein QXP36_14775 [Conexivisphaerales archaeon]